MHTYITREKIVVVTETLRVHVITTLDQFRYFHKTHEGWVDENATSLQHHAWLDYYYRIPQF